LDISFVPDIGPLEMKYFIGGYKRNIIYGEIIAA
jgi:hypothetical protein